MKRPVAAIMLALAGFAAPPATAEFESNLIMVCNRAQDGPAVVALAYHQGYGWISEGWHLVEEGNCDPLPIDDGSGYRYEGAAYYHAYTRNLVWEGRHDVCVMPQSDAEFRIYASDWNACNRGFEKFAFDEFYVSDGFAEVALTRGR